MPKVRPGSATFAAARLSSVEGVKRAFMHVMPVDPEQRGAVLAARDLVRRPELVDEGLRLRSCAAVCLSLGGLVEGRDNIVC